MTNNSMEDSLVFQKSEIEDVGAVGHAVSHYGRVSDRDRSAKSASNREWAQGQGHRKHRPPQRGLDRNQRTEDGHGGSCKPHRWQRLSGTRVEPPRGREGPCEQRPSGVDVNQMLPRRV